MNDTPPKRLPGIDLEKKRVKFDYIKGNYFRIIHVDGVHGGIGPRGSIFMSVWNERWPIPKQTSHEISDEGTVGKEIESERVVRDAVVREVEIGLIIDIETAKQIRDWLTDKIDKIESATKK